MPDNEEVVATGGGPATELADQFVQFLLQGLGGQFGGGAAVDPRSPQARGARGGRFRGGRGAAPRTGPLDRVDQSDPLGQTQGIAGVINDILGGSQLDTTQALQQQIQTDIDTGVADLRAGFGASGGTSLGTPASVGEAVFRSRAAPLKTIATEGLLRGRQQLQLQTLLPILQLMASLSGRGIPQAQEEVLTSPNTFLQILEGLSGAAQGVGSIATGLNA